MSFKCRECGSSYSNDKMAGMFIAVAAKSILSSQGIGTRADAVQRINGGDLTAGFLNKFVKCPKKGCDAQNWDYV